MIDRINKTSEKDKNQNFNIAGQEISSILDIDEHSNIAYKKFELLRKYCLEILGINQDSPYREVMNHYLRNGGGYFLGYTTENSNEEQLTKSKKIYILFQSVIERISKLDVQQKKSFLHNIKHHYDTDTTKPTEDVIIVMDRILSGVEKTK